MKARPVRERLDKIKKHLKDQKTKYLVVGGVVVGAVVGGTVVYFAVKKNIIIDKAPIDVSLTVGDIAGDVNSPLIEIIKNYAERGGHPGKKIYSPELGTTFRSLRQAAKMSGKSIAAIRECVNGSRGEVDGLRFIHIGDADAPFA